MSELTVDQALIAAKMLTDYFSKYTRIDEYMRDQKLDSLEYSSSLPGFGGPEDELFDNFDMHPNNMDFDIVEMRISDWNTYLKIISSHNNMTSVPGRNMLLGVRERNSKKWAGFIRLSSPVMMLKCRHELLGGVFTKNEQSAKAFNHASIMGFVIVPAQPFGYNYLGGKLLAAICCSHEVREKLNKKYDMNTCLFETTSLYGNTKSVSQYDGMKPYLRNKGLSESDFIPMMNGKSYEDFKNYMERIIGVFVPENASSRKLRIQNASISLIKNALKNNDELENFNQVIANAKNLTEQKRYYVSNYGFSNYIDVVTGKTDVLIPDKENYDKFYLENIIKWWKNKAGNRYETLIKEDKLRTELEVWTRNKNIDIIR